MITIIHGENTVASRKELQRIKDTFEGEILSMDGKNLSENEFIQATQSVSMFSKQKLVVIEGMVKFPFDQVTCDIVIWESKKTNVPSGFKNLEYKISQTIWKFLDNPSVLLFRQAVKDNDIQFIFLMLVRKYRLENNLDKLKELLEIDFQFKQGLLPVDLETRIELFLMR